MPIDLNYKVGEKPVPLIHLGFGDVYPWELSKSPNAIYFYNGPVTPIGERLERICHEDGTPVNTEDLPGPAVLMVFEHIASVDVVIQALISIRQKMDQDSKYINPLSPRDKSIN